MSNQKMIIALLGVVAVLLAVMVGVLVAKPSTPGVATTDPNAGVATNPGATNGGGTQATPPGMGTQSQSGPFDAAKATKAVGKPSEHVAAYFSAIEKNDFAKAFKLLPTDKQAQGEQAFAEQIKSYQMKDFKMGKDTVSGDTETIEATVQTAGGPFTYIWTFVKYQGKWVVKSRAIGGMGQ